MKGKNWPKFVMQSKTKKHLYNHLDNISYDYFATVLRVTKIPDIIPGLVLMIVVRPPKMKEKNPKSTSRLLSKGEKETSIKM